MEDILSKITQPKENLKGSNLYIAASVVEKASGALEEKELTSVKFVTSPYKLDLSKTKRYFTPGTPTQIVAEVSLADGSPPDDATVRLTGSNIKTMTLKPNKNGVAAFRINTENVKALDLKVMVEGLEGSEDEDLRLLPYTSATNSFLHIDVPSQVLSPGETMKFTVKVVTSNPSLVKKIYYMVLNKGQLLSFNSIAYGDFLEVQVLVTSSMVPSFRIVIYYHLGTEIVANSAWVDVEDVCEGKLILSHNVKDYIGPAESFNLDVETDGKTSVSLSVVDSAVYILNAKNKLTQDKMFKTMNEYDLGCSPGGGKDYKDVFIDAGLAFVSSAANGIGRLNELSCKAQQRKKRSAEFQALAQQKAQSYPTQELRRCCTDGMALLPRRMVRTCAQRSNRVPSETCRAAFRDCCNYAEKLRTEAYLKRRKQHGLGRTQEVGQNEDEDFADESDIQFRSYFPESWSWRTVQVDGKSSMKMNAPDSITTWEIQGIGLSKKNGFCIAKPVHLKVFKQFHIYLRVPYSIKRFEEMELRPVLYNYFEQELKVYVYMEQMEGICSPTTGKGESKGVNVTLPARSAIPVPFVVVPIGKSNPVVSIVALGQNRISDSIKKPLRIEREGVSIIEEKSFFVNPQDHTRNDIYIDEDLPSNLIPDGEFRSSIKVSMDSSMNTINNSLSADGISRLIRVPYGCAEQTMISTAPGVYALRYLDHTEKWTSLPPERKDEGLANMHQGYMRILQFRKTDGSYGAWLHRDSSTWLTAFVLKVMSLCRTYIDVDVKEIRLTATYITNMQNSDGSFREILSVIHTDMKGGVAGKNAQVSLTAFVTIALHRSLGALSEDNTAVRKSISKAIDYLRAQLDSLSDPYPLAITAYALNLVSSDSVLKDKSFSLAMSTAQGNPKRDELYFGTINSALAVETTSYMLLAALLRQDITKAKMMYTWLSEQQNYGGGFRSTQDTVMALEALSEYWIHTFKQDRTVLEVQIKSLEKKQSHKFTLRSEDNVQEELKSLGTKFQIKLFGKGTGIMTVMKMYNIMQVENITCIDLGLEVTVNGEEWKAPEVEEDYYDDYDDLQADEPQDAIIWHDIRKRARREVPQPKAKEVTVSYEVCIWRRPQASVSGMAIVDITMLSGFEPNTQDLNKLKGSADRYISHYELHAGRLLLYFDKIPEFKDCIYFDAVQTVHISVLQQATAILYDFYEPERRCTTFYAAPTKSNFIGKLCAGDVCQCAEGLCPQRQRTLELKENDRQSFACYNPRVVYGYRVKLEDTKEEDAFVKYNVSIVEVLQRNGDENIKVGDYRSFFQRKSCKLRLLNKEHLIMGQDGLTKDNQGQMRYLLEDNTWIEEIEGARKCKATNFRNMCLGMKTFMDDYRENGCMV
ncbi:complement C4-like isoform 2-T3 [Discoglossus pictus]